MPEGPNLIVEWISWCWFSIQSEPENLAAQGFRVLSLVVGACFAHRNIQQAIRTDGETRSIVRCAAGNPIDKRLHLPKRSILITNP